jgi:hypothetical protein
VLTLPFIRFVRGSGSSNAWQVLHDTCFMSYVTRHASHVTRRTSHVARHTSHVTRCTSHVTRHTSHVTRHTSHVTRHTSHVTPRFFFLQVIAFKTGKWVAGVVCSLMFGGMNWRFTLLSVALLYAAGVAVVHTCRCSVHRGPISRCSGNSCTADSNAPSKVVATLQTSASSHAAVAATAAASAAATSAAAATTTSSAAISAEASSAESSAEVVSDLSSSSVSSLSLRQVLVLVQH